MGFACNYTTASNDTLLDNSHGRRLETLSGWQTSSSAVHTSRETLVCCRRQLHTTDPPGNTYPTHRLNLQGKTLSHRLILTSQAYTYISSWKYLPQGIYPPGNTYLREHVCTRSRTGQQESMVIPSGICVHPIGSTSCSMVPSHERRKPGTTLQGGVAPDVTGTTVDLNFW